MTGVRVERENLAHREAADNCTAERLTHLGPGSAFDYERRSTLADVRYWHLADIARVSINVRLLGQSRHARDACLIHVIVEPSLLLKNITKERATMPTETLILVVVISAIFAVFAGALAWADFYTRGLRKS